MSNCDLSVLHNMSVPPRTSVTSVQRAVGPLTLFSTAHACVVGGLLTPADLKKRNGQADLSWQALQSACARKWRLEQGTDRFLEDLERSGITRDSIEECAAGITGSLIGWKGYDTRSSRRVPGSEHALFHPDPTLTLAILSHTVADLVLPRRNPDYSTKALFETVLCVSDMRYVVGPNPRDPFKDPPPSRGYIS
jgi:hypothetical protein